MGLASYRVRTTRHVIVCACIHTLYDACACVTRYIIPSTRYIMPTSAMPLLYIMLRIPYSISGYMLSFGLSLISLEQYRVVYPLTLTHYISQVHIPSPVRVSHTGIMFRSLKINASSLRVYVYPQYTYSKRLDTTFSTML